MDDLVESVEVAADPERPDRGAHRALADVKQKFERLLIELPKTDAACFSAIQGGDFTGYHPGDAGILPADHRRP